MNKLSMQTKILGTAALFFVCFLVVFLYAMPWLDSKNENLSQKLIIARKQLLEVQTEQRNFDQSKQDLAKVYNKSIQPDSLFSSDTSLVGEIKILEQMASVYGIGLSVKVNGTVDAALKAKTSTDIRIIPFSIDITGSYDSIVSFIDMLEHAKFITTVQVLVVTPAKNGGVTAKLSGNFYIKND